MIGIVGFGFVGQAVYSNCTNSKIVFYDTNKDGCDLLTLKSCKALFICLPTNAKENGEQDMSSFKDFFGKLGDYEGIVIIKSTCIYENIKVYVEKYKVVMNPEFLNANTAYEDFKNQNVIILGGDINNTKQVKNLYDKCFDLNEDVKYEFCSHKEAIDIKYFHNMYHAYKVLFWNFCYERTGNQRKISDLYSKITGNTNEMQRVASDGRLGYGGACFPKDVKAYNYQYAHGLTSFMNEYNNKLRNR